MSLKNLLDRITGNTKTTDSVRSWKSMLTKSVSDWKKIVKDPSSWDRLEKALAAKGHDSLYKVVLDEAGVELAKRWFSSGVDSQIQAAESWSLKLKEWDDFTDDMKMSVIKRINPGKFIRLLYPWHCDDLTDELKVELIDRITLDYHLPWELRHHRHYHWRFRDYHWKYREYSRELLRFLDIHFNRWHKLSDEVKAVLLRYVCRECREYAYLVERNITLLEETGDNKSLQKFKEQLARFTPTTSQGRYRVLYSPDEDEKELIARLMQKAIRNGYSPSALPPIFISSETPPIFITNPELEYEEEDKERRREEKWREEDRRREEETKVPKDKERRRPETISIEELLGVYHPREQRIIIYERGIKWRRHRFNEKWLFAVVLIHEIAHWITHLLPKPGTRTWPTDLYLQGEMNLHEGWAQLMTWWIAEEIKGEFKHTFEKLNQGQSPPYRVFQQFKQESIDEIMASLEKLRALTVPAGLSDWQNAI